MFCTALFYQSLSFKPLVVAISVFGKFFGRLRRKTPLLFFLAKVNNERLSEAVDKSWEPKQSCLCCFDNRFSAANCCIWSYSFPLLFNVIGVTVQAVNNKCYLLVIRYANRRGCLKRRPFSLQFGRKFQICSLVINSRKTEGKFPVRKFFDDHHNNKNVNKCSRKISPQLLKFNAAKYLGGRWKCKI